MQQQPMNPMLQRILFRPAGGNGAYTRIPGTPKYILKTIFSRKQVKNGR